MADASMHREAVRDRLRETAETLRRADRDVALAVAAARTSGLTDDHIAAVIGLSTPSLRQRYGPRQTARRVLGRSGAADRSTPGH